MKKTLLALATTTLLAAVACASPTVEGDGDSPRTFDAEAALASVDTAVAADLAATCTSEPSTCDGLDYVVTSSEQPGGVHTNGLWGKIKKGAKKAVGVVKDAVTDPVCTAWKSNPLWWQGVAAIKILQEDDFNEEDCHKATRNTTVASLYFGPAVAVMTGSGGKCACDHVFD